MKKIAAWIIDHPERVINLICVISMTMLYLCLIALSMHWFLALAFISFMAILEWAMLWVSLESNQWKKIRRQLELIGECKGNECIPNVIIQILIEKYKSVRTTVQFALYLKGYAKNPYAKNNEKETDKGGWWETEITGEGEDTSTEDPRLTNKKER
ncbi:MAG: hypothetical protein WCV67_05925 [Victivallaceae bacterium]|jgi:hypothetical protein